MLPASAARSFTAREAAFSALQDAITARLSPHWQLQGSAGATDASRAACSTVPLFQPGGTDRLLHAVLLSGSLCLVADSCKMDVPSEDDFLLCLSFPSISLKSCHAVCHPAATGLVLQQPSASAGQQGRKDTSRSVVVLVFWTSAPASRFQPLLEQRLLIIFFLKHLLLLLFYCITWVWLIPSPMATVVNCLQSPNKCLP